MDPRIDGNSFGKGTAKTFEDGFKHMMGIAAVRDIDNGMLKTNDACRNAGFF